MSKKAVKAKETANPVADWTVTLRVKVQQAGVLLVGEGRCEIMERIDQGHSISAAARGMGMSYRRAWYLVQAMNTAAGEPLVVTETGGVGGGGAYLTPRGRWVLAVYRQLRTHLEQTAATALGRVLEEIPFPHS